VIKVHSKKISSAKFKTVNITGFVNKMIIDVQSVYGNDGHTFHYDLVDEISPIISSKFNINFNLIPGSIPFDKSTSEGSTLIQEPIIKFDIPTNLFKNIAKLATLSECNMKVFFETDRESCMKIVATIKMYVTVYVYINPDQPIS
jgi:hypothetical protein